MSIGRMLVVLALLLPCHGPTFGSDDANALPADGTWVRYRTAIKSADGMIDYTGGLTIRVVGRKMDRIGPCRWIELQFVGNEIEKEAKSIYKLLIPERALLKESKPWQHAMRAWVKYDDEDVIELTPAALNGGDPGRSVVLGDQMLFWPGVLQQAKKTAKSATVEFRKARLNIPEGFAGQHIGEFPSLTSDAKRVDTTEFQMWFHRDVPFGFAFARIQTKSVGGDGPVFPSLTTEYSVEDAGGDAKSSLPEND